ncbi:MAG: AraC family ligand binding domain-containing protein, partial [Spirochaetia bacterium]|nr:AraC family ligand binding domain-containing protein [Spirochaetia bacterium]
MKRATSQDRLTIEPDFHGFTHIPSIGWSHYRKAKGQLVDHHHADAWEFCYLEKGRQIFATRDRLYDLRGGQIFLTLPNEVHS